MQTVDEIMALTGQSESIAKMMYDSCFKHIGEIYGCNKVTDVNYTMSHEKDIELTCTLCGKISHKLFTHGRNKWNELVHSCECQRSEKFPKIKKGSIRNDDPSFLGMTYGDYEVEEFVYIPHLQKSGNTVMWKCRCLFCGEERIKMPSDVKKIKKCQVRNAKDQREKLAALWENRIGEKHGLLTITGFEKRNNIMYAFCDCECGGKHIAQYINLVKGKTKSCGCLSGKYSEIREEPRTKSPLYGTWQGMRSRCNNPNLAAYKDYGGRGIKVCDEWNDPDTGFERFEEWAWSNGYVPESGLSLDRIDVNGNYEPDNCRYTTVYVQTVNQRKRKNRQSEVIEIEGESLTKKDWCKKYNISEVAVDYRIKHMGMDFETALKTPKSRKGNIWAGKQAKKRVAELNKCDSYIEANLYLALIRSTSRYVFSPQVAIGGYRVDFLVEGTNIIIECDGYDNHKTKEQIIHDNQRDRVLAREGYVVLRFSGSEINGDPDKCANEIIDSIIAINGNDYADRKNNAG